MTTAVLVAAGLLGAPSSAGGGVADSRADVVPASPERAATAASKAGMVDLAQAAGLVRSGTVITGQTVRFRQSADGAVQVLDVDDPSAPADGLPHLRTTATKRPGGAVQLLAVPYVLEGLVTDGSVDPALFDAAALADAPAGAPIRATVHYASGQGAAAIAASADAFPGSTLVPGSATATSATVLVEPAHGQEFWNAITRPIQIRPGTPQAWAFADNPYAPRVLRQDVRAVTSVGGAPVRPAAIDPEVTVTIRSHGPTDPKRWLSKDYALFGIEGQLFGTSGPALLQAVRPDLSASGCEDETRQLCVATFRVPRGTYDFESFMVFGATTRGPAVWQQRTSVRVDDDVTVDLYADQASRFNFVTPRPAVSDRLVWSHIRVLPGGEQVFSFGFAFASTDLWFSPTADYAVGGSALRVTQILAEPGVRMSLGTTDLGAGYTDDRIGQVNERFAGCNFFCFPQHRFADGTHRYPVADAGAGEPADYVGRDFTGKLALVKAASAGSSAGCQVVAQTMLNAKSAGAIGVILDPVTDPSQGGNRLCPYPTPLAFWDYDQGRPIDAAVPFIDVSEAGAEALRADLTDGTATVTLTAARAPSYLYYLSKGFFGGIPDDLSVPVPARSLSTTTVSLKGSPNPDLAPEGNVPTAQLLALPAGEFIAVAAKFEAVNGTEGPDVPTTITEYRSAAETDTAISVSWSGVSDGRFAQTSGSTVVQPRAGQRRSLVVGGALAAPGSIETTGDTAEVANRLVNWADNIKQPCTFCRDDSALWPTFSTVSGLAPGFARQGLLALPEPKVTVNGAPVEANADGFSFPIPEGRAKVTVSSDALLADGRVKERHAWTFRTAVAGTQSPRTRICIGLLFGSDKPCTSNPVVFLRYAPRVAADNSAKAGRLQLMDVTAYHEDPAAPKISRVSLSVSFDRGASWHPVTLRQLSANGDYRTNFVIPALARTNGYVSVRASATDTEGNSLQQTILDALALS